RQGKVIMLLRDGLEPRRQTYHNEIPKPLTENGSTRPNRRRTHAHATIDSVNATLPSIVFGVVGDQRCIPTRLPTIDAYPSQSAPVLYSANTPKGTHHRVPHAQRQHARKLHQHRRALKPHGPRAPREQVKVAQDRRAPIPVVQKLVHEDVDRRAEGVDRKVADVLGEREQRKGGAE
ncbi:hypothetical protein H0H81_003899, partial [Sphagnurus paluster]